MLPKVLLVSLLLIAGCLAILPLPTPEAGSLNLVLTPDVARANSNVTISGSGYIPASPPSRNCWNNPTPYLNFTAEPLPLWNVTSGAFGYCVIDINGILRGNFTISPFAASGWHTVTLESAVALFFVFTNSSAQTTTATATSWTTVQSTATSWTTLASTTVSWTTQNSTSITVQTSTSVSVVQTTVRYQMNESYRVLVPVTSNITITNYGTTTATVTSTSSVSTTVPLNIQDPTVSWTLIALVVVLAVLGSVWIYKQVTGGEMG